MPSRLRYYYFSPSSRPSPVPCWPTINLLPTRAVRCVCFHLIPATCRRRPRPLWSANRLHPARRPPRRPSRTAPRRSRFSRVPGGKGRRRSCRASRICNGRARFMPCDRRQPWSIRAWCRPALRSRWTQSGRSRFPVRPICDWARVPIRRLPSRQRAGLRFRYRLGRPRNPIPPRCRPSSSSLLRGPGRLSIVLRRGI